MSLHRVCILYLPSPRASAWHEAASEAARKAGWRVVDLAAGHPMPDHDEDTLINLSDAALAGQCDATERLIVADDPDLAAATIEAAAGLDRDTALRIVAVQYARGAELAADGWPVVQGRETRIAVPGLEDLTLEAAPAAAYRKTDGPLSFYGALPPRPGVSVDWPTDLLLYAEPADPDRALSDLTGRRRLLRYGPYLELSPGRWTVDVEFALSVDRTRAELRFEWGSHHDVAVVTDLFSQSGLYSLSLSKVWTTPEVAELRVWLDRAVFDGHMEIHSCRVAFAPLDAAMIEAHGVRETVVSPD
jgi:hypothetical protein